MTTTKTLGARGPDLGDLHAGNYRVNRNRVI